MSCKLTSKLDKLMRKLESTSDSEKQAKLREKLAFVESRLRTGSAASPLEKVVRMKQKLEKARESNNSKKVGKVLQKCAKMQAKADKKLAKSRMNKTHNEEKAQMAEELKNQLNNLSV
eukprot:TRINITY_DN64655_c0_g1_i1.p2 TRINITY_DN64655_c0_g1~~TRINITY_DN64655_c0_g1_i1.p2  ORF type:complete len:118 (-),score=37.41 TRINITY_DN64655_c0_g1_i1:332-685(-)